MSGLHHNTYQNTHTVMLDWGSYEVRLDEEGYDDLLKLVQQRQVCKGCYEHFTETNPNVSNNYCLHCFQEKGSKGHGLIFQGERPPTEKVYPNKTDVLRKVYWYLNEQGIVYTSQGGPGHGRDMEADRSNALTLAHWGFPVPSTAEWNGETLDLPAGRMSSFFGNAATDAVLALHYCLNHGSKTIDLYFLSQRHGQTMQLSKRKALHRKLYEEAQEALHGRASEWDVYEYIAQRLSAEIGAVQPALLNEEASS